MIELRGVSKRFPVTAGRRRRGERTVLHDLDLTIGRGEAVAVLGENGAGKSTLMKLIAGIQRPTTGTVVVRGRLGAMIELGAGFHPEQAAVPNLRAAATLIGVADRDIAATVTRALEFSELSSHVDKPLKHYSSGMVVRLAFALIAAAQPEILISDEVLAVGDESFQKKCISWLEGYLDRGGTLLLVSHNLYHAQKLCTRGMWLHRGSVAFEGDVFATVQAYLAHHEQKGRSDDAAAETHMVGNVTQLQVEDSRGAAVDAQVMGESLQLALRRQSADPVTLRLRRLSGETIWSTRVDGNELSLELPLPTSRLLPGRYLVETSNPAHPGRPGLRRIFRIDGRSREFGSVRLDHRWR